MTKVIPFKTIKGFGSSSAAITEMTYDTVGNVASVKDPKGNTTTFEHDSHKSKGDGSILLT